MDKVFSRVIAILKLERELSKNMAHFGHDVEITITDFTRTLTKEQRQKCYNLIDKYNL